MNSSAQGPLAPGVLAARQSAGREDWTAPWRSLGALLARRAEADPERPYLSFFDDERGIVRRWSYGEIARAAWQGAAQLSDLGIGRGGRVALLTGNLDHTIVLYLATWSIGACAVPINASESEDRKAFILEHSGSQVLFARPESLEEGRRLAERLGIALVAVTVDEEDVVPGDLPVYPEHTRGAQAAPLDRPEIDAAECEALLVYTSGTTGDPKGVLLDQRNILADADAMAAWHGWDETTRMACVLPVHHVNGLIVSHVTPLYVGGSTVLNARFSSRSFWTRLADEGATCVSLVPTLLQFLLEAEPDAGSAAAASALRSVLCGAGPLRVDTALEFERRFGVPLIHGYGLSETTGYNCQLPVDLTAPDRSHWLSAHGFPSIGCPLPHHEMTILDASGKPPAAGERGEICVRGDTVSRGYYGNREANDAAFRDGWFHSGDEGFQLVDSAGRDFFFITGRIKELIIRGGINYSPLEIDQVLNAHDGVQFGLTIPFENRYYGEEIAAYVVPHAGASPGEDEILAWCRRSLDFERSPKVVVFGRDVPYTTTGKPKRIELARQLAPKLSAYLDVQFRRPERGPSDGA